MVTVYHPKMRSRWLDWRDLFLCVVITDLKTQLRAVNVQKRSRPISRQVDQMTFVDKTYYMAYKTPFTCGIQKATEWAGYPHLAHPDSVTNHVYRIWFLLLVQLRRCNLAERLYNCVLNQHLVVIVGWCQACSQLISNITGVWLVDSVLYLLGINAESNYAHALRTFN